MQHLREQGTYQTCTLYRKMDKQPLVNFELETDRYIALPILSADI